MPTFELLALFLIVTGIWLWMDSLKARDAGMAASRAACQAEQAQLLDDSVAIRSLALARDSAGQLRIKRTYGFEYSDTGDNRRQGWVTLVGTEVLALYLMPRLVH